MQIDPMIKPVNNEHHPSITGLISDHDVGFALWRHSADLIRGAALARKDSAWAAVI